MLRSDAHLVRRQGRSRVVAGAFALVALLGVLLATAAGCGVDGATTSYAGAVLVTDPGGAWTLRALMPPWETISSEAGDVKLDIPPRLFSVQLGTLPTYSLEITASSGDAGTAAAQAAARAAALAAHGAQVFANGPVTTLSGATGDEVVGYDPAHQLYSRDDYFQAPAAVYRLAFTSIYDLRAGDVATMVQSFALVP